ncbi:unnamed protein product, partial [marine sediment metagenome]
EIKSVKMLGIDEVLPWKMTKEGLNIKTPTRKPCEHAYVFKIKRDVTEKLKAPVIKIQQPFQRESK